MSKTIAAQLVKLREAVNQWDMITMFYSEAKQIAVCEAAKAYILALDQPAPESATPDSLPITTDSVGAICPKCTKGRGEILYGPQETHQCDTCGHYFTPEPASEAVNGLQIRPVSDHLSALLRQQDQTLAKLCTERDQLRADVLRLEKECAEHKQAVIDAMALSNDMDASSRLAQ